MSDILYKKNIIEQVGRYIVFHIWKKNLKKNITEMTNRKYKRIYEAVENKKQG